MEGRKYGRPSAFGLFTFGLGNYTSTSATNKKVNGAKWGLDSREIKALPAGQLTSSETHRLAAQKMSEH